MAKEKKETAEQKLLKIIESSASAAESGAAQPTGESASPIAQEIAASVKGGGFSGLSLAGLSDPLGRMSALLRASSKSLGLREINKALAVLVVIFFILFGKTMYRGLVASDAEIHFKIPPAIAASGINVLPDYIPLPQYVEAISKRNIFQPADEAPAPTEVAQPAVQVKRIESVLTNIKLVGISWLDTVDSASAMIEDTISGTTYFIRQGEKIRDVTVKTIYADRVVMAYQGEELELRL